ncbi:MAG: nitroreductase family protein [Thermoplasmatota archaeon]
MEVSQAIKERRSIRSFKEKEVSKEDIKKLIEAAVWAPSGSNLYAWQIKAVRGNKKRNIERFSPGLMGKPPVLLVFCNDDEKSLESSKLAKEVLSVMDISVAAQNVCLKATDMGLGTCYIGSFNKKAVKEILDLPENIRPVLILSVGYPDKIPNAPSKNDVKETVEWIGWKDE